MRFSNLIYCGLVVASLLFFAVMFAISPLQVDDYWYLGTSFGKGATEALRITTMEMIDHLRYDTGRLANIINPPLLTIVPKWLFGVLSALCVGILFHVGRRMASIPSWSFRAILLICGIVVALPWTDYMFSIVQALNYLWASAIVLPAMWFIVRSQTGEAFGKGANIGISILCFAAGWMHEGFSLPALCGMGIYWLFLWEKPRKQTLLYVSMFCLGTICIFIPPAFWSRLGRTSSFLGLFTGWEAAASILVFNCLYFVMLLVVIFTLSWRKTRLHLMPDRRKLALLALFVATATASMTLFVFYYTGSRMSWFPQLMSGLALLYCFGFYSFRLSGAARVVLSAILGVLLCCHYTSAIRHQAILNGEYDEIVEKYLSSPEGYVFYDNIKPTLDFSLWKPSFRQFNLPYASGMFSEYYKPGQPGLKLFPSYLECIDLSKATPTSDPAIFIYGRSIISTEEPASGDIRHMAVRPADGDWISSRYFIADFVDSKGCHYWALYPHILSIWPDLQVVDARREG